MEPRRFCEGKNFLMDLSESCGYGERLLGLEGDHGRLMKLTKPMYGLCDASQAWFEEATGGHRAFLTVGGGKIVQHPLDACLFMACNGRPGESCPSPRLLGMFGPHVVALKLFPPDGQGGQGFAGEDSQSCLLP